MSNSKLVTYTKISPAKTVMTNKKNDTITIHCMAGPLTIEACGQVFQVREASSNYGIGPDGRIGMYVEEKDRSWATSSRFNDSRAVTIEVASGSKHPYEVTDKAYKALLTLCADICRRNGIKKLVWSTDKNARMNHLNGCNMTVHRDYANKACPGDYLYNRMGDIAKQVNAALSGSSASAPAEKAPTYKVGSVYKIYKDIAVHAAAGAGTRVKSYNQLTDGGKLKDVNKDGKLDKGQKIKCHAVRKIGKDIWIKCSTGWLAAYYNGVARIK